jgi:uncharacterized protein YdhG (YjbR/CyaY superfamily)
MCSRSLRAVLTHPTGEPHVARLSGLDKEESKQAQLPDVARNSMSDVSNLVEEYLEQLEPQRRAALTKVRALIREEVPEAAETMKYRMPTYEYGKGILCAFASQKQYMSLYMETEAVEDHKAELQSLDVGKSCIRFRNLGQLPVETVRTMLRETAQRLAIE